MRSLYLISLSRSSGGSSLTPAATTMPWPFPAPPCHAMAGVALSSLPEAAWLTGRGCTGLAGAALLRPSWYLSCQCSLSASSALTCRQVAALRMAAGCDDVNK